MTGSNAIITTVQPGTVGAIRPLPPRVTNRKLRLFKD